MESAYEMLALHTIITIHTVDQQKSKLYFCSSIPFPFKEVVNVEEDKKIVIEEEMFIQCFSSLLRVNS